MKFYLSKEWCMKMAELEGNSAIGAGVTKPASVTRYLILENAFIKAQDAKDGWLENVLGTLLDEVWEELTKEERAILNARL